MLSNATAAAVAVGRKFREHAAAVAVCECNFRESAVCTKTGTYVLSHATAAAVAVRRKFGVYAAAVAVNAVFAILLHVPNVPAITPVPFVRCCLVLWS